MNYDRRNEINFYKKLSIILGTILAIIVVGLGVTFYFAILINGTCMELVICHILTGQRKGLWNWSERLREKTFISMELVK